MQLDVFMKTFVVKTKDDIIQLPTTMSSTIVSIISPCVWDGMVYFANPFTLDTTGLQNFQSQLALGKSLFSCQMTFLDPYPLAKQE